MVWNLLNDSMHMHAGGMNAFSFSVVACIGLAKAMGGGLQIPAGPRRGGTTLIGITKNFALATAVAGALLASSGGAMATPVTGTVTTNGNTTGTGPWNLTSTSSTYSDVEIHITSPSFTLNELTSLSATFNDVAGGYAAGSPRMAIGLSNDGGATEHFTFVYFGSGTGIGNNDVAGVNAFSGTNLVGLTDSSRYEFTQLFGSSPTVYGDYADFLAAGGTYTVEDVFFILDVGAADELDLASVEINGTSFPAQTTPAPEPLTLSLMAAGLMGLGFARRKTVKA
jgi:hypothetical protein